MSGAYNANKDLVINQSKYECINCGIGVEEGSKSELDSNPVDDTNENQSSDDEQLANNTCEDLCSKLCNYRSLPKLRARKNGNLSISGKRFDLECGLIVKDGDCFSLKLIGENKMMLTLEKQ